MRLLISFVAAMLAAKHAFAEPPKAVVFSDLADPLAVAFHDPYKEMGFELLNELKLLLDLNEKLSQKDIPEDERARLDTRRNAAKEKLEANGQDVEALLSQRWDVAKKRQTARMATNPIFDGTEVTISGYLIPAPPAANGVGFGYLVPQVGMCSHLPPPPPNQLVRVKMRADQQVESLYTPVRIWGLHTPVKISGLLRVEPSDATIFILDGEVRMLSAWTLDVNIIRPVGRMKQE